MYSKVSNMSYSTKVAAKAPRSSLERVRRHRTNKMIAQASQLREGERICTTIKQNGERCKRYAIKGGFVCMTHGGAAPQVRARANKRLLALVEPSLIRLGDLVQQSEHMPTALGAIRTVLERAGTVTPIGPLGKDTNEGTSRPVVNIGIAIGGLTPEKLHMLAQGLPDIPAEVVKDDDDDE